MAIEGLKKQEIKERGRKGCDKNIPPPIAFLI